MALTDEQILQVFKKTEGILHGHFVLTSGRHSDTYMQCAKLFVHPEESARLCGALAEKLREFNADAVVSPAVGGIIMGYEVARQLGVQNYFAERENGAMTLRRGFALEKGMRVIVDGVFNHCGSFNHWLDREKIYEGKEGFEKGAYLSKDSIYRDYFGFKDQEDNAWPDNKNYEGWWGHETLPKLNYEGSETLYADMLRIAGKWVSKPYDVDGWRLDVAEGLGHTKEFNHEFWRKFRNSVKEAKPDAVILAEHYGDPMEWLQGDQWDTIMNYAAFMEPVSWFLTGMEKHSDEFRPECIGKISDFEGTMRHYMTSFMTPSLLCSMNQLSNHDHSRFLTRTNHKAGRVEYLGAAAASEDVDFGIMREAVLIQMTWPGAPTLYYGDEAGVCGFTDPDNRRTYPWGKENWELIDLHRELIRIHKENEAFRTGSFQFLDGEDNLLCYTRFNRKQQFVIIVNNDDNERSKELYVVGAGIPANGRLRQVLVTTSQGYSLMPKDYRAEHGKMKITMKGKTAVILERIQGGE